MSMALKKETQTLEDAALKLVELALTAGADKAEVCATYSTKTRVNLEKQDFHLTSADDGYQFGIRVLRNGRQGFASCNATATADLKETALRATEIAGFSPRNPYYRIEAAANPSKEAPWEQLWDDALHAVSLKTQRDWAQLMLEEATRDARFRLNEGSVTVSSHLFLVVNSLGTRCLQAETNASWGLMGMAVEGDRITSFDYFQESTRKLAVVPERLLGSVRGFRDRVVRDLEQGPARSYRGTVLFSPRAVADVLLGALSHHFNGRHVAEKTSRWGKELLGKPVVNPAVTVRDLPWLVDRNGCSVFDREGTPTRSRTLIENGVLREFLVDHYAGAALDMPSTGHALGGPTAIPTVGPHCLNVERGDRPLAELLSGQTELLVLHRFSGQTDPVTGDFSGVAKGGEWWTGGHRKHGIKETLVSGNLFDALGDALVGLSSETEVIDSSEQCPWLLADKVSVTAG